jgi:small GTP-binding protein
VIQKKVCMVGFFATGKTSLVRRFVESKFSDKYLSTVGVKIDRKSVEVGGTAVNLLLWDLEGRDGVQDLQTTYLRGASGVIYVVDGTRRETYTKLNELSDRVRGAVGEMPAVVALNKADLTDQWALTDGDREALAHFPWHVFTTSAKTGDGVEAAFLWLAEHMVTAS